MNLTKRCQLALAEIARRRAVIAAATPKPWNSSSVNALIYKNDWTIGSMASYEHVDEDCPIIPEDETLANATFIVASRNERDDELASLARAIEGLLQTDSGPWLAVQYEQRNAAHGALLAILDQLGIPL